MNSCFDFTLKKKDPPGNIDIEKLFQHTIIRAVPITSLFERCILQTVHSECLPFQYKHQTLNSILCLFWAIVQHFSLAEYTSHP